VWERVHEGVNVELVECVPYVVVEGRGVEVAEGQGIFFFLFVDIKPQKLYTVLLL